MEKVLTFTIRTEAGDSTMTIAEIERRLKELSKSKRDLQKEYEKEGKLTKEQQTKMKEYSTEIEVLRQKKSNLTKETRSYVKEAAAGQGTMARLRAETARLRAENENLNLSTEAGRKQMEANNRQIQANTKQIRDYDRSISGSSTLVGEYARGFKALGTQFLSAAGLAAGVAGAIKGIGEIIRSTQATADAFDKFMGGISESAKFFAQRIATLDFSNLISGFRNAFAEGKRYAEVLDLVGDLQRSLGIQMIDIDTEIARQRAIARNRRLDVKEREAAVDEIIALEKKKLTETQSVADLALENEITNVRTRVDINRDAIIDFISNHKNYIDQIKEGAAIEEKLRKDAIITTEELIYNAITESYQKQQVRQFSQAAYNDLFKNLTEEQQQKVRISKLDILLVDSQRDRLKETISASKTAVLEQAKAEESLVRLRNQLYNELIKEEGEIAKEENKNLNDLNKSLEQAQKHLEIINSQYYQQMELLEQINFIRSLDESAGKDLDVFVKAVDATMKDAAKQAEALNKEQTDSLLTRTKTEIEAWEEKEKRKQDITRAAEQGIANAVNGFHDMRIARMRAAMQAELNAVGNNEAAKEAIMRKYAREEQKMSVKKALIDTALMAISAGLTKPFIPAGLAAMITAVVQGGFQVATIKAQKFATGGSVRPGSELPGFSKHGDNTLALVKPGEVILNQRQQRSLGGASTFRKIGVPGFAEGGVVGAPVNVSPMEDMVKMANMIIQGVNQKDVSLNIHRLREAEAELDVVIRRKGL